MRNNILIAMFLFVSIVNYGQTKKIKKSTSTYTETFFVLKSDNSIKQGDYKRVFRGKTLVKGHYENNKKIGVWEYYDNNSQLTHKLDIEKNALVYDKNADQNQDFDRTKYSRPLIILGGFGTYFHMAGMSLRYPASARSMGTQGTVMVKFNIDINGKVNNPIVVEGIGNGCDEEAIRVIKLLEFECFPALNLDREAVESEIVMPLSFKLG